jgi:cation diffusion facilitator CzcD-associated flavoprotein CzcO
MTRQIITQYMIHSLNQDETLIKALIPDFAVGCRRMTPGVGYLAALTKPNVQALSTEIEEICPECIKLANGELIAVDAIVCATGFNLSFVPRFPIIGASGNLQDIWRDSVPAAYMSCMVPGMPNYFSKLTLLRPLAPFENGVLMLLQRS